MPILDAPDVPLGTCDVVNVDRSQRVQFGVDHFVLLKIKAAEWFGKCKEPIGNPGLVLERTGEEITSQGSFLYWAAAEELLMLLRGEDKWIKRPKNVDVGALETKIYDPQTYMQKHDEEPPIPPTREMIQLFETLVNGQAYKNRSSWDGIGKQKLKKFRRTDWSSLLDHIDFKDYLAVCRESGRVYSDLATYGNIYGDE